MINPLSVTTKQDDGSHALDWNKVVECITKLAVLGTILASAWAVRQSGNASAKADKAETHAVGAAAAVADVAGKVEQTDAKVNDANTKADGAAATVAAVVEKVESTASKVVEQKAALEYLGGSGVVETANAPAPMPEKSIEETTKE